MSQDPGWASGLDALRKAGYKTTAVSANFDPVAGWTVLRMREAGFSLRKIGDELGVTKTSVMRRLLLTHHYLEMGWVECLPAGGLRLVDGAPVQAPRPAPGAAWVDDEKTTLLPEPVMPPPRKHIRRALAEAGISLRRSGMSWRAIGDKLGCSDATVRNHVKWSLALAYAGDQG